MKILTTLKPNSKHREEVIENPDGSLTIFTKSPAIEGRANMSAINLLAKHYRVPKSKVNLLRGASSKFKTFEINV